MHNAVLMKTRSALATQFKTEGINVSADWLDMLMDMLMDLLKNCDLSPEEMASEANEVSDLYVFATNRATRRALVESYGPLAWFKYNGLARAKALRAAGKIATAEDFKALSSVNIG